MKGVDTPIPADTPAPGAGPTPPVQLAKNTVPIPVNGKGTLTDGKKPTASVTPATLIVAKNEAPVRPAVPVGEPTARPAPTRPAVLSAVPPSQGAGSGVSLQPFLSAPAPVAVPAIGTTPGAAGNTATTVVAAKTWRTYSPGQMPPGKSVRVNDIPDLSQRGVSTGEPMYLTGQFVVRATGENKAKGIKNAVLRSMAQGNVRVIVEYPAERPLPAEGSEVSRDEQRPYQITDVRQTADGTLNVYAREISGE